MADRYWVGGTGTWNTTSTTNWSATSGGASGASVPTPSDNVFFDQAGTYTVTLTGGLFCQDITVSAGTVTFTSTGTIGIYGSMTLLAGTTWSSGQLSFSAVSGSKTITTNGTTIVASMLFNGAGVYTLGSALALSAGSITVNSGTFDTSSTGNYSISTRGFNTTGTGVRTVNFNASTIDNYFLSATAFNAAVTTNLTFNAGTSQLNFSGSISGISSGGLTFYNVAFTSTVAQTKTITGANTYNNFSVAAPSTAGQANVTFSATQTINGTFSTTGTAGNQRVFFSTATVGTNYDLVINSAPSLTDADFRGLYVRGTAGTISGTRLGNRGECRGISFATPKTVYWNQAAGGNWSDNAWAASSGGVVSTDNFPLPQDTAVIENTGLNASATITLNSGVIGYLSSIDMSTRTSAVSLAANNPLVCYGNWTNGSGTSITNNNGLSFSGGVTHTITSAGKQLVTGVPMVVDTYGGTVQLADALNLGGNALNVTNGTFTTQGYAVTASGISSAVNNARTINLGASTVTLSSVSSWLTFSAATKNSLTFNAGTSNIVVNTNVNGSTTIDLGGNTYYNLTYSNVGSGIFTLTIAGQNTFNNLTINSTTVTNGAVLAVAFSSPTTVNGTFALSGPNQVRRVNLKSSATGTRSTITASAITATNADFQDIAITGGASGTLVTGCGDGGNNTGLTFPAGKTVYWNLAGAQNWSANAWAATSGGATSLANFPLAQDTIVFDNTGAIGTITVDGTYYVGTFDASARTSAATFSFLNSFGNLLVIGDWKWGTGFAITQAIGAGTSIFFIKPGAQTITSNGVSFGNQVVIANPSAVVTLADAFSNPYFQAASYYSILLTSGTFDAASYNVTVGNVYLSGTTARKIKMGSGTWSISGTGTIFDVITATSLTFIPGSANIVVTDSSASSKTLELNSLGINKLTIGGGAGTGAVTINGSTVYVSEFASTRTAAYTINNGTNFFVFGKWSVSGTLGNVVTFTASFSRTISNSGPAVTGVDYLSFSNTMRDTGTYGAGEFYAGANSINGAGNSGITFTAAPAPRTLYWVGGTGNWNDTAHWSTSTGGASGAAIPTSQDIVNFDSNSNATAYSVTFNATALANNFSVNPPASGVVTFLGSSSIFINGDVFFLASSATWSANSAVFLTGYNSTSTVTLNGVSFSSANIRIAKPIGTVQLGSAATFSLLQVNYGSFSTNNYGLSAGTITANQYMSKSVSLGSSAVTITSSGFSIDTNIATFSAGTSTLTFSVASSVTLSAGGTFYNISLPNGSYFIGNGNTITVNSLTVANVNTSTISNFPIDSNLVVNGGLTISASVPDATKRIFFFSSAAGTQRTLTLSSYTGTGSDDVDFRDIVVTGAAAPIAPTRGGDCTNNSGITFPAAKTVYWNLAGTNSWYSTGWATTSGGAPAVNNFPLAQDTAVIDNSSAGTQINFNTSYHQGAWNASARTTAFTIAFTAQPNFYKDVILSSALSLPYSVALDGYFLGTNNQTLTTNGAALNIGIQISKVSTASVTLGSALSLSAFNSRNLKVNSGTFDASSYNVTAYQCSLAGTSTVNMGSGTWTFAGSGNAWTCSTTVTLNKQTASIVVYDQFAVSSVTFIGGGKAYNKLTFGGTTGTYQVSISNENTFTELASTRTQAYTLFIGANTQRTDAFTISGSAGNVVSVSGTTGWLICSNIVGTSDYLFVSGKAANVFSTWYAGANSTNNGSLGWYFQTPPAIFSSSILESATGSDQYAAFPTTFAFIVESATGTESISSFNSYNSAILETGSIVDLSFASSTYSGVITEAASGLDILSASAVFASSVLDSATATETVLALGNLNASITESGTASEQIFAAFVFNSSVVNSASGTDLASGLGSFGAIIVETSTVSEFLSPQGLYSANLLESASIYDFDSGALLWNLIDDTQTPNWQNVNDSQTPGWAEIDDTQTPGWQDIQT